MTTLKGREFQVCVTHDDADGYMSAAIVRTVWPRCRVIAVNYGESLEAVQPEEGIIFTDISPPRDKVEGFKAVGAVVLDHHRASRDIVHAFGSDGFFADETVNPGVSSALQVYEHVFVPCMGYDWVELRLRAKLTGVRDTFQKDSEYWAEACAHASAVGMMGLDFLLKNGPILPDILLEMGMISVKNRAVTAQRAAGNAVFGTSGGVLTAIFEDGKGIISDASDKLFDDHPDIQLVAGFFFMTEGGQEQMRLVVSLRSRGKVDCGALAKTQNGGGHTGAGGFSILITDPYKAAPFDLVDEAIRQGLKGGGRVV